MSSNEMTVQDVIHLSRENPDTVWDWIYSYALRPIKLDEDDMPIFHRPAVVQFLARFKKLQNEYGSDKWKASVL